MPRTAILLSLLSVPLAAQEDTRDVPSGREVRATKLLTPGLTDTWRLDVERGEMLSCVVESDSFDPVLELVDAGGDSLGVDDGVGSISRLWLAMPATGRVEVRVRPFQGRGGGNYSFSLQRFRTEPLAADGEARHRFGPERWWHWRVSLRQGDVLVPTAFEDGRVTSVFAADQGGVEELAGGYRAPRDGDYLVRVEGGLGRDCRLRCQVARQRDLPADGAAEDTASPFGLDVWRLRLRAGAAYLLELEMPSAQLDWQLRAPRPDAWSGFAWTGALDKGGHRRRWLHCRHDCDLELTLRNTRDGPAPYRVRCFEPARDLPPGATAAGALELGGGALHQVAAGTGQVLRLTLASRAFDGVIDILDPDGNRLATVDDAGPLDTDPTYTLLVRRAGCYRVLVYTAGGAGGGEYTLRCDALDVPELQLGASRSLDVGDGGVAFAHVELEAGQEIWLSVASRAFDAALTLIDPEGETGTFEGGGVDGDVLCAVRARLTGRYTLQVNARSGGGVCTVRALVP